MREASSELDHDMLCKSARDNDGVEDDVGRGIFVNGIFIFLSAIALGGLPPLIHQQGQRELLPKITNDTQHQEPTVQCPL